MVAHDAANVMCCRYGSHVLRSLLCLCKGVPVDTLEEFHVTKSSVILAERMNIAPTQPRGKDNENFQQNYPVLFNFLVREMLNHAKDEMPTLRVNKYSSFVLQVFLLLITRLNCLL